MNAIINKPDTDIIDISIAPGKIKKIRIDGDDNRIVKIDVSDNNIIVRTSEKLPELKELDKRVREMRDAEKQESETEEEILSFAEEYKAIDQKMKMCIDYIFDSDVSEACCGNASMYDFIDGYMRYEIVFDHLRRLYDSEQAYELKKIKERVSKHTAKYGK